MFKRALSGLIIVNVFFFIPLAWVATSNVPRIFEADVLASASASVRVGRIEAGIPNYESTKGLSASPHLQHIKLYLPSDFPVDDFCVKADNATVSNVKLFTHFCLTHEYNDELIDGFVRYHLKGWGRLSFSAGCILLVVGLELILLILTLFCGGIRKRNEPLPMEWGFSAAVAALVSVYIVLILPVQSLIANRSLFDFSISTYIIETFTWLSASYVFLWIGLSVSGKYYGRFLHSLVISIIVYEYLRCGVLSIGEPSLNGEVSYYTIQKLAVIDMVVLLVILTVFTLGYHFVKPYLKYFLAVVGVLILASLADVKKDTHKNDVSSPLASGFCSKLDVAKNLVHSSHRNIMFMILDSIGTEAALDALAVSPELKKSFTGFTCFTNNIAVHQFTEPSVPAMLTGVPYDDGMAAGDLFTQYSLSSLKDDSFLVNYYNAGVPVSFLPGSFMFGYSSFARTKSEFHADQRCSVFNYRPDTTPPFTLFETVRFRLMPFAGKHSLLLLTFAGTHIHSSVKEESALYPILAAAPVDGKIINNLEVFHTDGGHAPFDVDRNGNRCSICGTDYSAHLDKTIFALKQLAELFDNYREKGIYDKSMIVVVADHGWMSKNEVSSRDSLPVRARAMLWVKPIGASGELKYSNEPTSHLRLKNLFVRSIRDNLSADEIRNALRLDTRVFRRLLSDGYQEWMVDAGGNSQKTR